MMTFTDAVRVCLKDKYATFSGRASRSEFWWFYLFATIVSFVAQILMGILGAVPGLEVVGLIIYFVVCLALFIPHLSAAARRLHDRNMSAWWLLLYLTGIGALVILIICILPSKEPNRFG